MKNTEIIPPPRSAHDILALQIARPIKAVLFDMDGVVTNTAEAHAAAWKRLFDEYLQTRSKERGEKWHPFDAEDYRRFVDGKPRYDGIKDFLRSREIKLPYGNKTDGVDAETIYGLGNRKNGYFHDWLDHHRVKTFDGAVKLAKDLRKAGIKTAVFSASRNAEQVLQSADVRDVFDAKVDGNDLASLGLMGKPDPAMLLEAASRLGVLPQNTAIVEDSIAGIEAGVRGGFATVIGVDRGHHSQELRDSGANFIVRSLSELLITPNANLEIKTLQNIPLFSDRKDQVRHVLSGRILAAFLDYDGTLTPIIEDYTKAFISNDMRSIVAKLAKNCTVAIVSGRDADVIRRWVDIEGVYYAGSHGFEIRGPKGWSERLEKGIAFLPKIDEAEQQLRDQLADIPGHAVERKRFAIAVHYRKVADADVPRVELIIDNILNHFPLLHKGYGKKVFRIQPNIDWDKGHAVIWLLDRLNLDRPEVLPIYVGDDITDEDAFRALAGRGLTLVVREPTDRPTSADYALADIHDVMKFLEFLREFASSENAESLTKRG